MPPLTRITPPAGPLDVDLGEAWRYRELLLFFVWRDIKVRYQQTAIGVAWVVVQPLLSMGAFSIVFGRLAGLPSDGLPYPVFYFAGLLPWMYFAQSVSRATNSLVDHQRVITKVYFPRLLLPASAIASGMVDLAIGFAVLALLVLIYQLPISTAALALPLFSLLAASAALGAGLWLSALHARYRDVRYAVQYLLTLAMFISPVAYPSSLVPEGWRWLYGLNPMATVIDGFRWALAGPRPPDPTLIAASAVGVVLLLLGGLAFFVSTDQTVADVV